MKMDQTLSASGGKVTLTSGSFITLTLFLRNNLSLNLLTLFLILNTKHPTGFASRVYRHFDQHGPGFEGGGVPAKPTASVIYAVALPLVTILQRHIYFDMQCNSF